MARSEGVSLTWRRDGFITISPLAPLNDAGNAAGNRQPEQQESRKQETTRDADGPLPMEQANKVEEAAAA